MTSAMVIGISSAGALRMSMAAGVVGTGTAESCTEAALDTALSGGGTVAFDCGAEPVSIIITSTKEITQDTTIDGGGSVTIDGNHSVRVFRVYYSGVTFTVENLTIANGNHDEHGGGISNNGGTLTVTNSTFSGNRASVGGGGIWNGGTLTVTNSTFSYNDAWRGGGIYNIGGTLTVTNSTFSGNSAAQGGGIFNITDCSDGGCPSSTVTVFNSTFTGNSAENGGGISNDAGTLTVTNSTLSGNGASRYGGGISNNGGTVTVTTSTFSGNSASDYGGGISNQSGTVTVTTSTFSGNSASDYGGGIFTQAGRVTVINSIFAGNSANEGGGGILNGSTLTVINSTFSSNRASGGGGILNGGTLTVTNSTFSSNRASGGGGILNAGTLTVTKSTFSANSTTGDGGGISTGFSDVSGTVTVTNSTFSGNSARSGGGIYHFYRRTVIVVCALHFVRYADDCFSGNSAVSSGGGAILDGGTLTVTNSTFSHNSAAQGGGISNITDCSDGGCPSRTVTVFNSTFTGNSANEGGGIFNSTDPNLNTTTELRNTVIADSPSGGNCGGGSVIDGGHNLDDGTSCGFSAANGSLSSTNPMLDPAGLANNGGATQTIALQERSPAINAGDETICAAAPVNNLDQRGYVRPGTGATKCSIGAYEYNAVPAPPCIGDCDATGSVTVDKIVTLVKIALDLTPPEVCSDGNPTGGPVATDSLIAALNHLLVGCPKE